MRSERGAILIQTTVAMLGLLAFAAFTVDYGLMMYSRRTAQNSADAAALAGAISMGISNPGDFDTARASAKIAGDVNKIFGLAPNITQGAGDSCDATQDVSFPYNGDGCGHAFPVVDGQQQCPLKGSCVRVNVYRNEGRNPLPTFFAKLANVTEQGVKATATAETSQGNNTECLLPFAIMDRWADNTDTQVRDFPWDGLTGIAGWSPNDNYEFPGGPRGNVGTDVYVGPYQGNTNLTGWTVTADYGREFIMKDGSVNPYSSGWFNEIDLPDSTGSKDYEWNIKNCNETPVGIAKETEACPVVDEAKGCVSVKTGGSIGPTGKHGIDHVVGYDPSAHWDWSATGPNGQAGAVVGGQGMDTPRIRPLVVVDPDNYAASNCNGSTCIGKVANIIGFFVEGVCQDVALDPGFVCDDPRKDIVGRIVTMPAQYVKGGGTVETPASFIRVIRLIR